MSSHSRTDVVLSLKHSSERRIKASKAQFQMILIYEINIIWGSMLFHFDAAALDNQDDGDDDKNGGGL